MNLNRKIRKDGKVWGTPVFPFFPAFLFQS